MSWVFKVLFYHIPKGTEKPQNPAEEAGQHAKTQTWDRQNIKQECQQPNQILDSVTQTTSGTKLNTWNSCYKTNPTQNYFHFFCISVLPSAFTIKHSSYLPFFLSIIPPIWFHNPTVNQSPVSITYHSWVMKFGEFSVD